MPSIEDVRKILIAHHELVAFTLVPIDYGLSQSAFSGAENLRKREPEALQDCQRILERIMAEPDDRRVLDESVHEDAVDLAQIRSLLPILPDGHLAPGAVQHLGALQNFASCVSDILLSEQDGISPRRDAIRDRVVSLFEDGARRASYAAPEILHDVIRGSLAALLHECRSCGILKDEGAAGGGPR